MMVKTPASPASLQAKRYSFQSGGLCMRRVQEMGPCPWHQVSQHTSCSSTCQDLKQTERGQAQL